MSIVCAPSARRADAPRDLPSHDDLAAMTVKELTMLCESQGIDVPGNRPKKADIVSAIEATR